MSTRILTGDAGNPMLKALWYALFPMVCHRCFRKIGHDEPWRNSGPDISCIQCWTIPVENDCVSAAECRDKISP